MLKKTIFSFLGFIAINASASSNEDLLVGFLQNINAASGTFTQETLDINGKVVDKTQGKFSFLRPDYFRWSTDKPYNQEIVSNGVELFMYDPDLMQVTKQKVGSYLGETPATALFGKSSEALKAWSLGECEIKATGCVKMIPKVETTFKWLEVTLRNDYFIDSLRIRDNFSQTIKIKFDSIKKDNLDKSDFEFKIPDGVDVIENAIQ